MLPLTQWPMAQRREITGVFTDIDDTLTERGTIAPEALRALHALKNAGLHVIPITGRPVGWCRPFAIGNVASGQTAWPADAFVVENGGAAFLPDVEPQPHVGTLGVRYPQDAATRAKNRFRMDEIAARVIAQVPGVQRSRDSAGRETDLAFDYREFAALSDAQVAQVLQILQSEGMQTHLSSIHIHGCFGHFDKWQGACWAVRQLFDRDLSKEIDQWVFVGDSANDEAMFANAICSVGVANIRQCVAQLTHLPRYVTQAERGAGFAELVSTILAARR
jgi:HAD superfamily hydrolase (TIGR01484 family)